MLLKTAILGIAYYFLMFCKTRWRYLY